MKLDLDLNDAVAFSGMGLIAAGVSIEFGYGYASIIVGVLLFGLGIWNAK